MSGFVLWFTGLSAAGKTTIANVVAPELEQRGCLVELLDGDVVRTHLSKGLGYSKEDRDTNIARIGWVASRLARAGATVIVSAISPYEEMRRHARALVEPHAPFVEVHVATPIEECARRDPKGLYAQAFAGELDEFTGVSAPYEAPVDPELRLDTSGRTPSESAAVVLARLEELGLVEAGDGAMSTAAGSLTHLDDLEAEAVHIFREVAAELERPVLLFSGGKDSIVLLKLAEKAFRPGKFPFPVMHVDTGHNFPEVIEFRDRRVAELGRAADRRVRAGVDRQGTRRRGDRPARVAEPAADDDAARRHRGAPVRRGHRRRAARRGAQPREGADLLVPRRLRPVEPARAAARAVEPLQRARPQGRARPRVPDLELDGARRVAVRRARESRAAVDLLRARARGLPPRRDDLCGVAVPRADGGRGRVHRVGALPHRRRHVVHRRRGLRRARRSRRS